MSGDYDFLRAPAEDAPTAAPASNDYDFLRPANTTTAAAKVRTAPAAPDAYAKASQTARAIGVPAPVAARHPERANAIKLQQDIAFLTQRAPKAGAWLAQDDNAAIAHDDLDNLGLFESLFGKASRTDTFLHGPTDQVRTLAAAFPDVAGSAAAGWGRGLGATGRSMESNALRLQDAGVEDTGFDEMMGLLLQGAEGPLRGGGDLLQSFAEAMKPAASRRGLVHDVQSGLGQLPWQVATGGTGLLGQGAEIAGERADAAGATQAQTDAAVFQGAAVTAVTEKLGLGLLLRRLPAAAQERISRRLFDMVLGGAGEGASEAIEGVGHDLIAQQYDPDTVIGQGIGRDFTVASAVGFIARGVIGGHPRVRQIEDSAQGAQWLDQVAQAASASKVAQRSPEHLATFVAALKAQGGPQEAFLSAETFVGFFQSEAEAYTAAAEMTGNPDALPAALAGQGDIAIPMEKFVPYLATNPEAAKQAKLQPDHLTGDEAAKLDREKEVQAIVGEMTAGAKAETVDNDLLAELSTRYKPGDAKVLAKLLPRFYERIADATGRSVDDVRKQYPLQIVAQRVAGYDQPADGTPAAPRGGIAFAEGGIGTGPSLVHLAATADQTTFLHETGHFFLEVLGNEASNETLGGDFTKILDWFGVDAATWKGLDLEGKRPHHEKFARAFEQYLGEGKAPAPGLRSAFRKFKQWIVGVYKDLRALNTPLSDDVRGVFDRLLAADHEIEAAAQEQRYTAAIPVDEAAKLGLSKEALTGYAKAIEKAKEALAAKLLQAKLREKKAWYRDEVKAEAARVAEEAKLLPVYRVRAVLAGGAKLASGPAFLAANRIGPDAVTGLHGLTAKDGIPPDALADLHGYVTTDAMLRDLIDAPPFDDFVKHEAESRVLQRHGDPLADARTEAMDALHNARLAQAMQAEIRLLAKLAGEAYYAEPKVIEEAARRVIDRQTLRQSNPTQYLVAERKAANEAAKAAAKGKFAEALVAKRAQAFNAALYRHATAMRKKTAAVQRLAGKLARKPAQARLAKAGHDYLAQVNDLLATYSFRPLSVKERDRRQSLRAFVERMQADGEVTAVADSLLARVEAERVVNFRDVPAAEVLAIGEALKNISHLSRLKNKLLAGARKAKLDEAVAEMVDRASASLPGNLPDVVDAGDLTGWQKIGEQLRGLEAELTRPETIIEALDGGESGPWHDFLWAPQITAENTKIALMQRVGSALKALHKALPADFWARTDESVEFKGQRMKRYTLISAAFNLGNDGNRQRLRDGGISTVSGKRLALTDADLASIPTLLTAAELRYVQGVWDAVDSLRPDIEALTRRMGGIPVDFVQAAPLSAVSSDGETITLRGGYWPLAYHHERSLVGERQEGDDALKILMAAGAARAATSKGYTQARAEEFSAPLLLNFGQVLSRSLDQVMTDLSYREAVRDTTMLLKHPDLKAFLHAKLGKAAYDSLNGGVAYSVSANADVAGLAARGGRKALDFLMANGVVSVLAIRPDIALGNAGSALVQGLDRVGARALLRGLRRLATDRRDMTAEITRLSPFMANRLQEIDHDYAQAIDTSQGKSGFRAAYFRVMMTLHRTADHEVTRALWWGRYEAERRAGADSAEAVRLADKAIRQTQTASGRKDLSTYERDTAFKQSRVFMGPMAVIFGRLMAAGKGQGATRQVGQRAASLLRQWGLAPAIFALLAGRVPDDDDEDGWGVDDWARWVAINCGLFPMQTMPIVREFAVMAEAGLTDAPVNPRASPTAQAAGQMAKATRGLVQNLTDDEGVDYSDATRDLVGLTAPFTGLPSSQYRKSDKALEAVLDDPERGPLELTELVVYGRPTYTKEPGE